MESISPPLYNNNMEVAAAAQCTLRYSLYNIYYYCYCPVSAHTGVRQPSGTPMLQRQDTLSSSSEAFDYQLEISTHSLPIDQRSSSRSSHTRVQHSAHLSTGATTPNSRMSHPTSLRLSAHSDMNASPIMRARSLGRSQDDDDDEAITGIRYPPNWGQRQSLPRQSPAAGSDESFYSAESQYLTASLNQPKNRIMVSVKSSLM